MEPGKMIDILLFFFGLAGKCALACSFCIEENESKRENEKLFYSP